MGASARWLAAACLLAVACSGREARVTHFNLTCAWPADVTIDQLRFEILDGDQPVIAPATRPQPAMGALTSGETVAILLKDAEVGHTLTVRVTGLFQGVDLRWGEQTATPILNTGVDLDVSLDHAAAARLGSIAVSGSATLPLGATSQLTAIGAFSDGTATEVTSTVTWTSSDPTVATVGDTSADKGLVTALKAGSVKITAQSGAVSGSLSVVVTSAKLMMITVTPTNPLVPVGRGLQLTATGAYSDGTTPDLTTSVMWSSSDPSIAVVNPKGMLTALQSGAVTVTARLTNVSGTDVVAVTPAVLAQIMVTPANALTAAGSTPAFLATGIYSDQSTADVSSSVSWSTSDMTVATISNAPTSRGVVSAVQPGAVAVTASQGGVTGSTMLTISPATLVSIAISPASPVLAAGTAQKLVAVGTYSDQTTQDLTASAHWSSSNSAAATVRDDPGFKGSLSALVAGSTTISGNFGGVTGTTLVSVTAAALTSISISPSTPSIAKGTTVALTASGTFSDGSTQDVTSAVTWASSNVGVVVVSNSSGTRGLATSVTTGSSTIAATLGTVSGSTLLTVTAATLTSLGISPASPSLAKGTTRQLTATAIYSDGTSQDATAQVTWTCNPQTPATVSNAAGSHGLAAALNVGSTTVTASLSGVSATTLLTVTAATLKSLSISPTNPSIANGTSQPFTASALYSDGTVQDATAQVTWSSSAPAVASISNAPGSAGRATSVSVGTTQISASLGGLGAQTTLAVTAATLTSIAITPSTPSLPKGTKLQLEATATYSNQTTQDVTQMVTWSSAMPGVVDVSNAAGTRGNATGVALGSTTLTATLGGVSGTVTATVTAATLRSVSIAPASASLPNGTTQQLGASAVYSDGSTQDVTNGATWQSADPSIAVVSNGATRGLVTAVGLGGTTVTVTLSGTSAAAAITVTAATLTSITLTPPSASLPKGTSLPFTATGNYSDHSSQDVTQSASWSTGDGTIATVSNAAGSHGQLTGLKTGSTTVSASVGAVTGSAAVTVTAATLSSIAVTPSHPSIANGTTEQFSATATYSDSTTQDVTAQVTWASSAPSVAAVSNGGSHGLAQALQVGSTSISATLSGVSGSTTLAVTAAILQSISIAPTNPSIAKGTQQAFTATAIYSDLSTQDATAQVAWSSSSPLVASISNTTGSNGVAAGLGVGSSTISASLAGVSAQTTLTITTAVITGLSVTPTNPALAKGTTQQLSATALYSDGSTQDVTAAAAWQSTNGAVASVSGSAGSAGLASALGTGSTTITAAFGGQMAQTTLTVTPATLVSIAIAPLGPSLAKGTSLTFSATGTYSDSSTQDVTANVTWTSSLENVATISNAAGTRGLATAVDVGTTNIGAVLSGVSTQTTLRVTPATVKSIAVTPAAPAIAAGLTAQLTATATFSDNSTQDVTQLATWVSTSDATATVSNAGGARGLLTAVAPGSAGINATFGGATGSATVTVTSATLQSITLSAPSSSLPAGASEAFTATGHYSDGSTLDLTSQVTWSSSKPAVATASNAVDSPGLCAAVAPGSTIISAALDGVTGMSTLTVGPAQLVSIAIAPMDVTLSVGTMQLYTATGLYTDNSTTDLTALVTWTSDDTNVASFDPTPGELTANNPGTTYVHAKLMSISSQTSVTVQ